MPTANTNNSYTVTLSDGTDIGVVFDNSVVSNSVDDSFTSLSLLRRGSARYSEAVSENLVHILENFAKTTAPAHPLTGQLWFDKTGGGTLKVYSNTGQFVPVGGTGLAQGLATPVSITLTGPVTGTASFNGMNATTIATTLTATGVTPGTYSAPTIVVDAAGRISAASNAIIDDDVDFSAVAALINSLAITKAQGGTVQNALTVNGPFNVGNGNKVQEGGNALLPAGAIIMWSGSTAPAGWALCDGSNGRPDLRNRFVVGVGSSYGLGTTGGVTSTSAVNTSEVGDHSHTMNLNSAGGHSHGGATGGTVLTVGHMPAHSHTLGNGAGVPRKGTGYGYTGVNGVDGSTVSATDSVGGNSAHNHSISTDGEHTHSGSTSSGGRHFHSVPSFSTVPPYYALAYIIKL